MKCVFIIFILFVPFQTFAIELPRSFEVKGQKAVFVDFIQADYQITYDMTQSKALVSATLFFKSKENGHPLFDLVEKPDFVSLNSLETSADVVASPDKTTRYRMLGTQVYAGELNKLVIFVPLTKLVKFENDQVKSAFWNSDLTDRRFLEQYLPTSFEFDNVKMSIAIKFEGGDGTQQVFSNGQVNQVSKREFHIEYPEYYNCSSLYFHTTPKDAIDILKKEFTSIDGRVIPLTFYKKASWFFSKSALESLYQESIDVLKELENDYGPFPHNQLIVYNQGLGGMEYAGATMTSKSALGHEITHSYFARGLMPANGNAGWLDEAIASWRDDGYPTREFFSGNVGMSTGGEYVRKTNTQAYSFGANFMGYLDFLTKSEGGLKKGLRNLVENYLYTPYQVSFFIEKLDQNFLVDLSSEFEEHTYSSGGFGGNFLQRDYDDKDHPIHHKLNPSELLDYL